MHPNTHRFWDFSNNDHERIVCCYVLFIDCDICLLEDRCQINICGEEMIAEEKEGRKIWRWCMMTAKKSKWCVMAVCATMEISIHFCQNIKMLLKGKPYRLIDPKPEREWLFWKLRFKAAILDFYTKCWCVMIEKQSMTYDLRSCIVRYLRHVSQMNWHGFMCAVINSNNIYIYVHVVEFYTHLYCSI